MTQSTEAIAQQVAQVATAFQQRRTAHEPKSVSVVLGGDTVVVTLHGALSPAEAAMAQSPQGATQVQELHRQALHDDRDTLREEIKWITGMEVRQATVEVEPRTGAVVHVFTSGVAAQVFLLDNKIPPASFIADPDVLELVERRDLRGNSRRRLSEDRRV